MLKTKIIKKNIIALLVISLIYANINLAVLGSITYAIDNKNVEIEATENEQNEEAKVLKIEVSEFCKNNMQEQETEYQEKLTVALEQDKEIGRIEISDINTKINFEELEENATETEEQQENITEPEENINIFYKTTKINKEELVNKIGTNGLLEIKYNELETEAQIDGKEEEQTSETQTEETENGDIIVLPEVEQEEKKENIGIINAENGTVIINSETEAGEEGNITIVYPENTISIEFEIKTEVQKIENLEILNNKSIAKVSDLDKITELETAKQVTIQGKVEVIEETVKTPIEYTKTFTELGVDKNQVSTTVENKVNFTITMHTESIKYDLNKNPYFVIELPNIVDIVNIDNMVILNNPCFTITSVEQGTLENGNKAITIKLEGEQTEYTKSIEENTQIVLETSIKTRDLIPTTENAINLYYQNENVKTYDGKTIQENGFNSVPMQFISNKEVIVETKAIVGEQTISSPREDYNSVTVEPNTYQSATIIGTVINNLGESIQNAKILGSSTNIGPISGAEKVYYTENENATADLTDTNNNWQTEYTSNAKKYLIIVDNFEQAQTIQFGYYMGLPANIEEDIIHEAKFEVYDDSNQVINVSKTIIYQEAEQFDTYFDEEVKADITFGNETKLEVGEMLESKINITNTSEQTINDVELYLNLPENLEYAYSNVSIDNTLSSIRNNKIVIKNINLQAGATISVEVYSKAKSYVNPTETITANISYKEKQIEIFNKIEMAKPAQIEATITSDKTGKILEANEEIEYIVTLKNTGESNATVDFNTPQLENIYIQKIETINVTTGGTKSITSGDLTNGISVINIASNEVVQVKITCIAKPQEEDTIVTMYANITGDTINDVKTAEIYNKISKKIDKKQTENNTGVQENSIFGVAWIDKNGNGQQDKNEVLLKGVQAILIDTQNLQEVDKQITNNKGEYNFKNIEEGSYIVEFKYNTQNLNVTKYKSEKATENLDSDIINATQNEKTIAKTEVMTLTNGETKNINAGFIVNKKFDMDINQSITNVAVTNEQGSNTYEFAGTNMAKVEIDGKYLKGSIILVEYEVAVTNIGEVDGYARLISDKIPEGMKFNSELNKDWYEGNDGNLYTSSLANKKLLPGETATIKLVLTKEMTDDKIVSPVNTVKIEETYNEYFIQDKEQQNNIAEATVIISLTTGQAKTYVWLIIVIILIISLGILGVIKISNKNIKERRS